MQIGTENIKQLMQVEGRLEKALGKKINPL